MANLSHRLFWVMGSLVAGTVLAATSSSYFMLKSGLESNLDESLIQIARTELASATDTGFIHVHEPDPQTISISGVPGYEKFVCILDDRDNIVARTANVGVATRYEESEPYEAEARAGKTVFGNIKINGSQVRAVFYPLKDPDGAPLVGVVGIPTKLMDDFTSSAARVAALQAVMSTLLALLIVRKLAKSLVKPLGDLATSASQIDPEAKVPQPLFRAPYREISSVVTALNQLQTKVRTLLSERDQTIEGQRRFIADASHELRTPVSNIQGTLEVALRRERSPEEYRESLSISLNETQRIGRLINDLLTLSKTDIGQFQIRKEEFELTDLVHNSLVSVPMVHRDRLQFKVEIEEPVEVFADPERIRQALDNLVRNASVYASSKVVIRVETTDPGVRVSVKNDGPCLAPGEETKVFERFYRADHSRSRDSGGAGLGLAIVKSIMELHGGSVGAKSEKGWTTFWIDIPPRTDSAM